MLNAYAFFNKKQLMFCIISNESELKMKEQKKENQEEIEKRESELEVKKDIIKLIALNESLSKKVEENKTLIETSDDREIIAGKTKENEDFVKTINKNKDIIAKYAEKDSKASNKKDTKASLKKNDNDSRSYIIVWLLVFAGIAILFLYNAPDKSAEKWNQSKLVNALKSEKVLSIKVTPVNQTMLLIEGEYKRELEETIIELDINEKNDVAQQNKPENKKFICNVLNSEALKAALNSAKSVKVINDDTLLKAFIMNILPVLLLILVIYLIFSRQIKQASRGAVGFGKSKAKIINPDDHKTTFDDVAGAEEAKEEIVEIVEYLKDPLKFKLLGAKIPKGALLTGPPGTGKTLLAKAVAGEAGVPFYSISGSDFVEMFVGVGASRVRDMFEQARAVAPCLIFIDEIDAVGRSRFSGIGGGNDEREQTLNAMLVEMDGLETQEGVIVLAATNRPDVLDPALLRPGRFDRQIMMDLPDIKGRRQILEVHIKNIKVEEGIELDKIARGSSGFSGADLANLVNEAGLIAAKDNREAANIADLEEARDKVRWGRERKSRRITDKEKKITAYHEAGHALVGLYTESEEDDLHKVTIIPRGNAYLGATMYLPNEDKYTQSRNELKDRMAMTMGGRVAEELVFNDITSGAAGDIESATHIAKMMVCYYGMSDVLGPIQLGEAKERVNMSGQIVKTQTYSEDTAQLIDVEVKKMLDEAKAKATTILTEHQDQLELLSVELLDKETLEAEDIKELLGL